MAWTYWTGDLASGDIITLEMLREFAAAAQERYQAAARSTNYLVRLRGGTNGDHRVPLAQGIEYSLNNGSSWTTTTPHGLVETIHAATTWIDLDEIEAGNDTTLTLANLRSQSASGLSASWADLATAWAAGNPPKADYLTMCRRAIRKLVVRSVPTATVNSGTLYSVGSSFPATSVANTTPIYTQYGYNASGSIWDSYRCEAAFEITNESWFTTATRLYVKVDLQSAADDAYTPTDTIDITLEGDTQNFPIPSILPGGGTAQEITWGGFDWPGGYQGDIAVTSTLYNTSSSGTLTFGFYGEAILLEPGPIVTIRAKMAYTYD